MPQRLTLTDIADQAGVAYGLVYHYFDSKEEILNTLGIDPDEGLSRAVLRVVALVLAVLGLCLLLEVGQDLGLGEVEDVAPLDRMPPTGAGLRCW